MKQTWSIENHICHICKGRILRCVTGAGMQPGGNLFRCSCCGKESYSCERLCYCGFRHPDNNRRTLICQPFSLVKKYPELEREFKMLDFDIDKGEIGFVRLSIMNKIWGE